MIDPYEGLYDPRTIAVAETMWAYKIGQSMSPESTSWCRCAPSTGWGIYRHIEIDPALLIDAQVYTLTDGRQ